MKSIGFHQCEGILLRKTPVGDSDLVLSFLTERGTETFFAKAALRSRKRFSGQLDYFRRLSLASFQKSEGPHGRLESAQVIEAFPGIWQDPDRYLVGSHWIALLRELLPEGKGVGVYPFICDSLRYLHAEPFGGELDLRFQLRLSIKLGYGPNWGEAEEHLSPRMFNWLASYYQIGKPPFALNGPDQAEMAALLKVHWRDVGVRFP